MVEDCPTDSSLENDAQILADLGRKIQERWKVGDPGPPVSCLNESELSEWRRLHQGPTKETGLGGAEFRKIEEEELHRQKKLVKHRKEQKTAVKEAIALVLFDPEIWERPFGSPARPRIIPSRVPTRFRDIWKFVQEYQKYEVKKFDKTQVGEMLKKLIEEGRVEKFTLVARPIYRNTPIQDIPPKGIETYYRLRWPTQAEYEVGVEHLKLKTEFEEALAILKKHNLMAEFKREKHNYPAHVNEYLTMTSLGEKWISENKKNFLNIEQET